MGSVKVIVVDTHVFLWYVQDDPRLMPDIKDQLELDPSKVFVPSICIWEALLLAERGRIGNGLMEFSVALRKALQVSGFSEAPLTAEIAEQSRLLTFAHSDPADRFIAATAHVLKAQLATQDNLLRRLPWVNLVA